MKSIGVIEINYIHFVDIYDNQIEKKKKKQRQPRRRRGKKIHILIISYPYVYLENAIGRKLCDME